jgi:hypothetical protein
MDKYATGAQNPSVFTWHQIDSIHAFPNRWNPQNNTKETAIPLDANKSFWRALD